MSFLIGVLGFSLGVLVCSFVVYCGQKAEEEAMRWRRIERLLDKIEDGK